jgi:uncharacterized cupredoxin-like copper-binding protein
VRRARGTGLALLAIALVGAAAATAAPRIHRTTLPPPVVLPTQLSVDETEWSVRPSKRVVAAGDVRIQVYNRGMDDHDLAVVDATGTRRVIDLAPRSSGELVVNLPVGRHKIWCSLFEGTALSHEDLGMVAYIQARPQPVVASSLERRTRAAGTRR